MWQLAKREAAKASPSGAVLPLLPHVGETDTDALAENPDRTAETVEEAEEEEDEFGYSWSEFILTGVPKLSFNEGHMNVMVARKGPVLINFD